MFSFLVSIGVGCCCGCFPADKIRVRVLVSSSEKTNCQSALCSCTERSVTLGGMWWNVWVTWSSYRLCTLKSLRSARVNLCVQFCAVMTWCLKHILIGSTGAALWSALRRSVFKQTAPILKSQKSTLQLWCLTFLNKHTDCLFIYQLLPLFL